MSVNSKTLPRGIFSSSMPSCAAPHILTRSSAPPISWLTTAELVVDAVDDALRYELRDERRDALVEVRAAAGDDGDLAAPFLGFDDFVYRRVESFARAFVEAVVKFLY